MTTPPAPGLGPLTDRTFAGVVFDMDGTLVDSTAAVIRSWTTWAKHWGITAEQLAGAHGKPSSATVSELLPPEHAAEALAMIDQLEIDDVEGVVALPGAVDALVAIPANRVAIATSCRRPLFEARMAASGLAHPAVTVTFDDVDRGKPHPDPFLLACEQLGLAPTDCLVVEDAVSGLTGARLAGCSTLAVVTTSDVATLSGSGVADGIVPLLDAVRFVAEGDRVRIVPST